eukprot:gnl/MRDRNA2_/MRDRNA2_211666_c0_seq1.p2 gnl/MRDRNA2_/MRDRNA2_211666_c0~~gnl/MRDRNA2_/MRDRNA2_211666_c0_seq1.p2  ORF type:complete len:124 (+),score=20.64 gnl/MRDRNA2_/MRDRNA2_211666_c0_seq1:115-486(+)
MATQTANIGSMNLLKALCRLRTTLKMTPPRIHPLRQANAAAKRPPTFKGVWVSLSLSAGDSTLCLIILAKEGAKGGAKSRPNEFPVAEASFLMEPLLPANSGETEASLTIGANLGWESREGKA